MRIETVKKANELIRELREVDEQLEVWSTLKKQQLCYTFEGTDIYREFGKGARLISDEVFAFFRSLTVGALKVKKMELTDELENLTD